MFWGEIIVIFLKLKYLLFVFVGLFEICLIDDT
jgi:hypothetical protein